MGLSEITQIAIDLEELKQISDLQSHSLTQLSVIGHQRAVCVTSDSMYSKKGTGPSIDP